MRYVIGLSFAALAVWALQATGILMGLMMFLMIGTIPGTHVSIPPVYMLALLGVLMLATLYWLFRQRPVRQIQEMRVAYHEQIAEPKATAETKQKRGSFFIAGFTKSYTETRQESQRRKYRAIAHMRRSRTNLVASLSKNLQPLRNTAVALGAVIIIASKEMSMWARPHIRRAGTWLRKQIGYSVKGTMLSAHRWSSLSKKVLSSLTSLLKRCNSVLKRGKSLLIRSAR